MSNVIKIYILFIVIILSMLGQYLCSSRNIHKPIDSNIAIAELLPYRPEATQRIY